MQKLKLGVWGLFIGAGAMALGLAEVARAVAPGEIMPTVTIARYSGDGALNNSAFNGKVTVINFWATWCAACKVELVEMEDQFKPYLTEKDFQLAFVSLDKEPEKAAEWFQGNLKEPALFLKHLYHDGKFATADQLKVDAFPMTFVIGKDGKIAFVQHGYKEGEKSTQDIVKLAARLLHDGKTL